MEAENTRLRTATESQWASLIKRAFKGTAAFTRPGPEQVNTSFEETMLSLYGIRLRRDACIGFENTVDVDAQ